MNIKPIQYVVTACAISLTPIAAYSAPVAYDFSATVVGSNVTGSYTTSFSNGDTIQGTFISDTDETNVSWEDVSNPDELIYVFTDSPYGAWLDNIDSSFSFVDDSGVVVDVLNNLVVDQGLSDDLNGLVTPGTYDIVGIFGGTSDQDNLNGEDWGINFIASSDWFTTGSGIPESLPLSYDLLIQGEQFDDVDSIGTVMVLGSIDNVSAVPVPAAVWLFGSGLIGLIGVARRKKV